MVTSIKGNDTSTFGGNIDVPQIVTDAPAFSAWDNGGNQTINNSTFTKVNFNNEEWDTNNNFASSTFTPTVAGYYQLSASFSTNGYPANSANNLISLRKNGNNIQRGSGGYIANGSWYYATISTIVYANGTTDYFDIAAFQSSGTSITIQGTSREHRTFCGVLVRAV